MKMATTRGPINRRPREWRITRKRQRLRPKQSSRSGQCESIQLTRWPSGWQLANCKNSRCKYSFCIWHTKEKSWKFLGWWRRREDWHSWWTEARDIRIAFHGTIGRSRSRNSWVWAIIDWQFLIYACWWKLSAWW